MRGTSAGIAGILAAVVAAGLVSCAASVTAEGTWGEEAEGMPQLVLAKDGSLQGTDGCNRLTGAWSAANNTVTFEGVASTAMACDGVDAWLSGLSTATIDRDTLTIKDASGAEIGQLERS